MILELEHTIVPKGHFKSATRELVQKLKKKYSDCQVITFSRNINDQDVDIISVPVPDNITEEQMETLNQKIEGLMKDGYQMGQSTGSKVEVGQFGKAAFDPTSSGLKFDLGD